MNFTRMAGLQAQGVLVDGEAVIVDMQGKMVPTTISVEPAAGDTVTVEVSVDGGTTWYDWLNGDVTSASTFDSKCAAISSGITHVRFTRSVGTGTTSTWSIC